MGQVGKANDEETEPRIAGEQIEENGANGSECINDNRTRSANNSLSAEAFPAPGSS